MEAAALTGLLEQTAERLIPPAMREAVLGDLRESSPTGGQYVREIMKIVPFVIVSQAARYLNLPVLMLQVALIFYCWGRWAAALALPVLILREAYQPLARPNPQNALRAALLLSFSGLLLVILTPLTIKNGIAIIFLPHHCRLCSARSGRA